MSFSELHVIQLGGRGDRMSYLAILLTLWIGHKKTVEHRPTALCTHMQKKETYIFIPISIIPTGTVD